MFLSTKSISYSGILLSINTIIFLMINHIQINTLFLMMIASFLSSIIVIEFGNKEGFVFSLGASLFGFIFLNNKMHFILYLFIFCYYGVVKSISENQISLIKEYLIKCIYFNFSLILLYFMVKDTIFIPISAVFMFFYQILYLVYDKVYTSFVIYYKMKFKNKKIL